MGNCERPYPGDQQPERPGQAMQLDQTADPRWYLLRGSRRYSVANDAWGSSLLENGVSLFQTMGEERSLETDSRLPARQGPVGGWKKKAPTAAILDSQSVRTASQSGIRGYDAGKKVLGRKRHIVVDTLGFILGLLITDASVQDRDGGWMLLSSLLGRAFGWLKLVWADGGYAGKLVEQVAVIPRHRKVRLEIVKRSDKASGFTVLPKRWIVERTFGWLIRNRRLVRDYEANISHSESMIYIAMIKLMLARLAR